MLFAAADDSAVFMIYVTELINAMIWFCTEYVYL